MRSKLHTKIFQGQFYKQAPLEVQEILETAPQSSFQSHLKTVLALKYHPIEENEILLATVFA